MSQIKNNQQKISIKKHATLCFLLKEKEILLAMKKRGFGVNKWNGTGGKVNLNESIENAAIRETKEEINVQIEKFKKVAELDFYFLEESKKDWSQKVHAYLVTNWQGKPSETEEMKPQWFKLNEIPFNQMWEDDEIWLPHVLNHNFITGEFYFDNKQKLQSYSIKKTKLVK